MPRKFAKVLNTDYKEIIRLIQASKDRLYIERYLLMAYTTTVYRRANQHERGVLWEFEQINIDDGSTWYEMYVQCDTIESRFYKRGVESDIYDETHFVRFPGAKGYVYTC
ncbi:hypothetical protein EP18_14685 [Lysinibacillus sphaericus]|nr:hypothetical protein [Lysinibacillus sphaericus]KEK10891.1 hypothetical protein EP18_14685 [Lysinibacillus sphaericus]